MEALTLDYNAFAAPEQFPVMCVVLITREEHKYIYIYIHRVPIHAADRCSIDLMLDLAEFLIIDTLPAPGHVWLIS
jgi:hypothetical protein